jgi:hypothetical protein
MGLRRLKMRTLHYVHATTDQLVRELAATAHERGAAVLDYETRRANRMYDKMHAIGMVLRSRSREARLALTPLLDDKDRFVRYYAVLYLLGLVPDRARPIIEWNCKYQFDALAGDARGLLRDFDNGEYKPD